MPESILTAIKNDLATQTGSPELVVVVPEREWQIIYRTESETRGYVVTMNDILTLRVYHDLTFGKRSGDTIDLGDININNRNGDNFYSSRLDVAWIDNPDRGRTVVRRQTGIISGRSGRI